MALAVLLAAVAADRGEAQVVRFGIGALGMTYSESGEGLRWEGEGLNGTLWVRYKRFGLDATGYMAKLKPDSSDVSEMDMLEGDLRVSFSIVPAVAIEAGIGHRRAFDPEFSAQDVGFWRLGVLSEMPLARMASIWARGAYLIAPQFDGGGEANLSVEVSLGVGVGTANGRFRVRADYEFQRIDREVNGVELPIQLSRATIGVELGF
jgi:hypothetical protein